MDISTTKRELMRELGFTVQRELAEFFGVSLQAVSQWADEDPIPELRMLQLRLRRPELFTDRAA